MRSADNAEGTSPPNDRSTGDDRIARDRGRRVSRRSFLGGLGGIGTVGLLGAAVTQGTQQGQEPGWLQARGSTTLIEATGDFNFPDAIEERGLVGSGAIVDPSGIALTNAHVVSGADALRVYVGDDRQRSYNARILGVSDCVDLAVIDIEGEGFQALRWRQEEISPGLQIAAHGFPIGGQTMASTRGIVSRVEALGETTWASVDSVLEHTATIAPGSSGGPLVDDDGNLVGVNYATSIYFPQYYAVGRDVAEPIIQQLRQDQNVHYLGMGTVAIEAPASMTPDGITRALHVITVEPGSPAWNTGIRPGDRIVRIRGSRAVYPDTPIPTKEFYCDVLRTQGDDAVYPVQVFRPLPGGPSSGTLYEGEINGQPLQPIPGQAGNAVPPYTGFRTVSDDTGTIRIDVPVEWAEVDGTPVSLGARVVAAPDIDDFFDTWTTPGVLVVGTDDFGTDTDAALDQLLYDACQIGQRESFSAQGLAGQTQRLAQCAGTGTSIVNVAALPEDESYMIVMQQQLVSERDEEAFDRIVESLQITGDPGDVGPETTPEPDEPPETETPAGTETPTETATPTETGTPTEDGEAERLSWVPGGK